MRGLTSSPWEVCCPAHSRRVRVTAPRPAERYVSRANLPSSTSQVPLGCVIHVTPTGVTRARRSRTRAVAASTAAPSLRDRRSPIRVGPADGILPPAWHMPPREFASRAPRRGSPAPRRLDPREECLCADPSALMSVQDADGLAVKDWSVGCRSRVHDVGARHRRQRRRTGCLAHPIDAVTSLVSLRAPRSSRPRNSPRPPLPSPRRRRPAAHRRGQSA